MALQILALKPIPTTALSRDGRNGMNLIGTHSDATWLEIFEKDIDESVLKSKFVFLPVLYILVFLSPLYGYILLYTYILHIVLQQYYIYIYILFYY